MVHSEPLCSCVTRCKQTEEAEAEQDMTQPGQTKPVRTHLARYMTDRLRGVCIDAGIAYSLQHQYKQPQVLHP